MMRTEALDCGALGNGCYTSKQGAWIYFSLAVRVSDTLCVRLCGTGGGDE